MSRKYRPSNGDEGFAFMERHCRQCVHDQEFQRTQTDGCTIVALTLVFSVSDPEYPSEWTYDANGYPTCTAFRHVADVKGGAA